MSLEEIYSTYLIHFKEACGYLEQKVIYLSLSEQIKKQLKDLTKLYKKSIQRTKLLESESYFIENNSDKKGEPYYYLEGYGKVSIDEYQRIEKNLYSTKEIIETYIAQMNDLHLTLSMNINNPNLSDSENFFAIISFFCMQIQQRYQLYLNEPFLHSYSEILEIEEETRMTDDFEGFMNKKMSLIKNQLDLKKSK